jgi:hypothetical protein
MNTRFTGHGKSIKNAKLSTALKGNTNASKGGARTAVVGGLFGPVGNLVGGAYIGNNKDQKAQIRHRRTAGAIGTLGGAIGGSFTGTMLAGPFGTVPGAIGGAIVGGATNYGAARLGQALTKKRK